MIALTYLSHATAPLDQGQLEDLLRVSRERNLENRITGMLLYVDRQFIQTLEGERPRVEATLQRILADPRHRGVHVAFEREIEERDFPEWSMGFRAMTPEDVAGLPGFTDYLDSGGSAGGGSVDLGPAGAFHRAFRDLAPRQP